MKKEIVQFLKGFHFIRLGKRTVALGKNIPFLFEIKNFKRLYRKNKFFISRNILRDYALLKRTGYVSLVKPEQKPIASSPSLSLHIAHTCNLACDYCFVKENMRHGRVKLMSPDTAKKAVNFFYQSIGSQKNQIIFVGGEPLLNMPAIRTAIREIRKHPDRKAKLTLITNGTLLDKEKALFFNKNKVEISISHDGIQKEHDRKRRFKDGGKTSRKVLDNIRMLSEMGISVSSIKTTIPRDSAHSVPDFVKSFKKIPVHPWKFRMSHEYSFPTAGLKHRAIPEARMFFRSVLEKLKKKKGLESVPLDGLEGIFYKLSFPLPPKEWECGFTKNRVLVTPGGEFFFCGVVASKKFFRVGSLQEGIDHARLARLHKIYRVEIEKCKSCWAYSICSYYCPLLSKNKKALAKRCEMNRLECKTMIEAYTKLKPKDIRLFYRNSDFEEDVKVQMEKAMDVGFGLRSVLRQNTFELKPLSILPLAN